MPTYCSFLVFHPDDADLVLAICEEVGWLAELIDDPSGRYRFAGKALFESLHPETCARTDEIREGEELGKLLLLEGDYADIDNTVLLIFAAILILEGFPNKYNPPSGCFELADDAQKREEIFENVFRKKGYFEKFTHRDVMPTALALAAKAWTDRSTIYAIHKLADSIITESVSPWSMHPSQGQTFEKHSPSHASHVGTSTAINLAYSAIQELGLDVKSGPKKPRWLDKDSFEWNPKVLSDLEKPSKSGWCRSI